MLHTGERRFNELLPEVPQLSLSGLLRLQCVDSMEAQGGVTLIESATICGGALFDDYFREL